MINPTDCVDLGITDGDRIRIGNERGDLILHCQVFEGVDCGVVVVESIWPNNAFEEGIGINLLISADAGRPNGGAVLHDTVIWIRAA